MPLAGEQRIVWERPAYPLASQEGLTAEYPNRLRERCGETKGDLGCPGVYNEKTLAERESLPANRAVHSEDLAR